MTLSGSLYSLGLALSCIYPILRSITHKNHTNNTTYIFIQTRDAEGYFDGEGRIVYVDGGVYLVRIDVSLFILKRADGIIDGLLMLCSEDF